MDNQTCVNHTCVLAQTCARYRKVEEENSFKFGSASEKIRCEHFLPMLMVITLPAAPNQLSPEAIGDLEVCRAFATGFFCGACSAITASEQYFRTNEARDFLFIASMNILKSAHGMQIKGYKDPFNKEQEK